MPQTANILEKPMETLTAPLDLRRTAELLDALKGLAHADGHKALAYFIAMAAAEAREIDVKRA